MPKITAALLAAWQKASANDPPPNPRLIAEERTQISYEYPDLQRLIEATGARQIMSRRGTRFERLRWDGPIFTAQPADRGAAATAMLDGFDDWTRQPSKPDRKIWHNRVAQTCLLDGELIVAVTVEAMAVNRQMPEEARQ